MKNFELRVVVTADDVVGAITESGIHPRVGNVYVTVIDGYGTENTWAYTDDGWTVVNTSRSTQSRQGRAK